jgi:crossover junction endodeoxyribonuclease RuvC
MNDVNPSEFATAFMGIDPGLKGALVGLDSKGGLLWWRRMPVLNKKEIDAISIHRWLEGKVRVCIEKVHAMPKQGVTSMFTFGMGYGMVRAAIEIACAPCHLVTPQRWQKVMLDGMDRSNTKEAAVTKAVQLWPELRVPLMIKANQGVADAALMAEYGRRLWSV